MNSIESKPSVEISKCVRIHADHVSLLGDLQIPEQSSAIVVFAYAGGRCQSNPRNRHVAQVIRQQGISTLLCDLLTEDEEIEDEISEKYRHDAVLLANRLLAVTRWLAEEPDCKGLRLGIYGVCAGGAAALIAAAKLRDKVGAVVTRGGRIDLAVKSLPLVKCPVMLVVGDQDTVGLELNREALPHLKCTKHLEVVPGASHLFGEPGKLHELAKLTARWFRKYLPEATSCAQPVPEIYSK